MRMHMVTAAAFALVAAAAAQGKPRFKGDAYPLDHCIVSGEKLGQMGPPAVYIHEGRHLLFCCKKCIAKFKADPDRYLAELDEAIIRQQKPYYPLRNCVVMEDDPLEEGEAKDLVYYNRLVRFCCRKCVRKFKKDPETYLKRLDRAVIAAQKKNYPLDTCVVSGEKLGEMGEPVDFIHANRLVRFCCKMCIRKFQAHPARYLAKLRPPARKDSPRH